MNSARLVLLGAAALLLAGCGDDRPYSGPGQSGRAYSAPMPIAAASPDPASPSNDPLLAGPSGAIPTDDPLLPHDKPVPADPLAGSDPLKGRGMPTEHSHWLNTEFSEAQVSVLLNGMRLSSSQPPGTEDVTMKLRHGVNTVTVIYAPRSPRSWGSVTLSEGEHERRAIPLAVFRCAPAADAADPSPAALEPTTQTFTFYAN